MKLGGWIGLDVSHVVGDHTAMKKVIGWESCPKLGQTPTSNFGLAGQRKLNGVEYRGVHRKAGEA